MPVNLGQRKDAAILQDCVEIRNSIEDGDKIAEACQERADILRQDSFGYIDTRPVELILSASVG